MFGLDYVIFRPHNVYGERQNIGDRYRNVAGIFMNQIMQGQPLTIFGDGEQSRAFTYVGDVIPVIADSPSNPKARNQIFNVGADTPYTVNELAEKVASAMGVPLNVMYLDSRDEVKHAFSNHDRLRDVFAYTATVSLEEGLARMASWARTVGTKQSKRFSEVEVTKNMPKSWLEEFSPDREIG
jgi:UDP-glucose 4-epimerase